MKLLKNYFQATFSPISLKKALVLSLFAHITIAACLAVIANQFQLSNQFQPLLIFDFVFSPAEDLKNSEPNSLDLDKNPANPKSYDAIQKSESSTQNFPVEKPAPEFESTTDETVNVGNQPVDEFGKIEPGYVPESEKPVLNENLFAVNEIIPAAFTTPKTGIDISKVVPAKISMSPKQVKMLNKKFRKWTEDFYKMNLPDSTLIWEHKGEQYKATFNHIAAKNNMDMDEVLISIQTDKDGIELSSQMKMKRLAFSNYAQFVDHWDPLVAVHNDELDGRFHANSQINITKSRGVAPKFYGKVTTSSREVKNSTSRMPFFDEESIFLGGLETGVKPINLPRKLFPFISEADTALSQVYKINEDAKIVFHQNGSFTVTKFKTGQKRKIKMNQDVCYIFGGKKAKLHLKGIVKGKALVYAADKIIIDGDLTYANHPLTSNKTDDYLGLLSEKNIEIAHPDITGPGDLQIFASLYAKRRFVVRHLSRSGNDTLYIFGSLAAGSISATEPRYATHITFDKRLERSRPPSFPMTNRYEVSQFESKWNVKNRK